MMSQENTSSEEMESTPEPPLKPKLSPELQLLYQHLSELIDKNIQPIDIKSLLRDKYYVSQQKTDILKLKEVNKEQSQRLCKVEKETSSLKQKLTTSRIKY